MTLRTIWRAVAIVCVLALSSLANAQAPTGFTLVTATKIQDGSGYPLQAGTVTFFPVNHLGKPISAIAGGAGGMITQSGAQFPVVNGVMMPGASGQPPMVADTLLTTPIHISYRITVTDASGAQIQGPGYGLQQPSGPTWSLDTAAPNQPMEVAIQTGPPGPAGPKGDTGASGASLVGSSDVVLQTASQGTVNLVTLAPATGRYRISYYADQNALCIAGATSVWFTFAWTDATRSRSVNSVALQLGAGTSAASSIQGSLLIFVASGSAITYTSTVTGACTSGGPSSYDAHITVEAVQ